MPSQREFEERRLRVREAMSDPEYRMWTDLTIAQEHGVHRQVVKRVRADMGLLYEHPLRKTLKDGEVIWVPVRGPTKKRKEPRSRAKGRRRSYELLSFSQDLQRQRDNDLLWSLRAAWGSTSHPGREEFFVHVAEDPDKKPYLIRALKRLDKKTLQEIWPSSCVNQNSAE